MALEFHKNLKGDSLKRFLEENHLIIFLLNGGMICKSNIAEEFTLLKGNMVLIPMSTEISLSFLYDTEMMMLLFREMPDGDTAAFINSLKAYIPSGVINNVNPHVMEMAKGMDQFFDFLQYLNTSRWRDNYFMNEMIFKTIMFIYKNEHSLQDNALFFYTLISNKYNFKNLILGKHLAAKDVKQLARMCNMPYHTFTRRFAHEFKTPPYQWMIEERKKRVRNLIEASDLSMKEIADKLHFCSIAHLSKFCSKYFGLPPSVIRKKAKSLNI